MRKQFDQVCDRARSAMNEVRERSTSVFGDAKGRTFELIERYRPSDETLDGLKKAAVKGAKELTVAVAALAKELVESKPFKDAAKGAGAGAVIAVPVPLVGPMLGALIGAGVGVYIGHRWDGDSTNQNGSSPTVIEVLATPIQDLGESLRSLNALRAEGLLTDAEFEALKQKLLGSVGK